MSTSSIDDTDKKLRGFQHIIQDLSAENAELKERIQLLTEETGLLKEVGANCRLVSSYTRPEGFWRSRKSPADCQEIKLLEETGSGSVTGGATNVAELRDARSTIESHLQTIKEVSCYSMRCNRMHG